MESKKKKLRKMQPYTKAWEKLANQEARNFVSIEACRDCGRPYVRSYRCPHCGSTNHGP